VPAAGRRQADAFAGEVKALGLTDRIVTAAKNV